MSKIFITGGAGFIGAHIVRTLEGNNTITVFDKNITNNALNVMGYSHSENVRLVEGDVLNKQQVLDEMGDADVVIHAAAVVGVDKVNDQLNTMTVNILGTHNILEASLERKVSGRVVVFSTSEIFGPMAYRAKETDPVVSGPPGEPRWGYGISKIACEHFAMGYFKRHGLPTVCVRPFNIYGPGQTMNGAMKEFIARALKNEDIYLNGDGSPIRAWCYVGDFAKGVDLCISKKEALGESFNIGNARTAISVMGLAEKVIALLGSSSRIVHRDPLAMEIHLRTPSIDKARELLGYEPVVGLDEGIMKTAEFVKKEMEINHGNVLA